MTDNEEILALLGSRDEGALSIIDKNYGRLMKSLALRLLSSEQDAEECVNDVLLEIWNTIPPQSPSSVSSYACMLTRRTAIDRLRYNNAEKRREGEYYATLDELDEVVGIDDSELDSNELTEALNEFLGKLTPFDRQIFMSRYYGFETSSEIAQRFGIRVGAVNTRLSRIRAKLKSHLSSRGFIA